MTESTAAGLLTAMLAVQAEAPTLPKDRTVTVKTKTGGEYSYSYTPLDSIVEKIGPLLAQNGLVWTAQPSNLATGEPTLKYKLAHAPSKESIDGEMRLVIEEDHREDVQALGSAITYARRYALSAVLNLVADADDDGRAAGGGGRGGGNASTAQKALVRRLFTEKGVTRGEAKNLLASAGVTVAEGEDPRDAVDRLRWPAVSELIDFLKQGPLPVGGSDVPADGDGFTHEPAGEGDVFHHEDGSTR